MPPNQIGERIEEMLDLVQMADYRYASPRQLSGGQKQRVVLAAVLALNPQILLLDEALSQLDFKAKAIFLKHLENLRKQGRTMLMVDHDDILADIATQIIKM
jgi:energy-coupling factor transporter ATP-binding protein EcfA2